MPTPFWHRTWAIALSIEVKSANELIDGAHPTARATPPLPNIGPDEAWFVAEICRNCDSPLTTAHCPACGQKAAKRYNWRDVGAETWERLRVFELKSLKTAGRLIVSPGTIAREWVMGRRTDYMHPLKLFVALVAALVLMLAINQYFGVYTFTGRSAEVDRMAQRVMAYANWSFSLGIIAVFFGSWTVFHRRLGYNAIEHAVLAVFVQDIILIVILINMLPTLIWRDPAFVIRHKEASAYYLPVIKLAVVLLAYKQFFALKLPADLVRLVLAGTVFAGLSWLLVRAYAHAIFWLVT
jgi:hypothetical protein